MSHCSMNSEKQCTSWFLNSILYLVCFCLFQPRKFGPASSMLLVYQLCICTQPDPAVVWNETWMVQLLNFYSTESCDLTSLITSVVQRYTCTHLQHELWVRSDPACTFMWWNLPHCPPSTHAVGAKTTRALMAESKQLLLFHHSDCVAPISATGCFEHCVLLI